MHNHSVDRDPAIESSDVKSTELIAFLTSLADISLIQSQRLSEWTGHGPALELDIAMTNIALDYLGQARMFYQYIAELSEDGSTEDSIAYLRDTHEYRNCLLVELPNGDWAQTVLKIFFISAWQSGLYKQLRQCPDERLAAISAKSLKEVNYHLSWSADWMKRFGNGTAESNQRVNDALVYLWNYTGELFCQLPASKELVNYSSLEINWLQAIGDVFNESSLQVPNAIPFQQGGYHGRHTEYLGYILAEMQWLQRVYPGCEW